jgi:hypothetical protein
MGSHQFLGRGYGVGNKLNLALTDDLRDFVDRNSGDGTLFITPGEFVRALLREKKECMEASQIRGSILESYQDALSGRTVSYRRNLRPLLKNARR